ncbi:MAG: hypothetical protein ACI8UZ_002612 [Akkermansiaceae bacterium]
MILFPGEYLVRIYREREGNSGRLRFFQMINYYQMRLSLLSLLFAMISSLVAEDRAKFRTDENRDKSLEWFQPVRGEFPPKDSAHYISGELIGVDHPERILKIRVDRNDSQSRALMDYPLTATMIPCGTVSSHNQPASLQDIPIGTHVHGWFFERPSGEEKHWGERNGKPHNKDEIRASPEVDFTRCLRIEDDFTYHTRRKEIWKIEKVELQKKKLTAILMKDGKPSGEAKTYDLQSSTVVYQGKGFASQESIAPGQLVQMNLTWATLFGPGRVLEIWLDQVSRDLASARQLKRHHDHIRERGIPGWIMAVDDQKQIVTVTFFDGIDEGLLKDLDVIVEAALGWPTSGGAKDDLKPKGTLAVARDCLMTYDIVNDRKGGNILAKRKVPSLPGSSGVKIEVQCGMLLEGFRPSNVVRFFPACWPIGGVPREETFFGRE